MIVPWEWFCVMIVTWGKKEKHGSEVLEWGFVS